MSTPSQLKLPKEFFVKERDGVYSNWPLAFWREFFQNSVDAGAKRIDITVEDAPGRGSFGRPKTRDDVVRVRFADNGCGMDATTLDEVYFSLGRTTKENGDGIGGFGRARLMTCFSQLRYAIRTQDRVVEGDGAEYTNVTSEEAISYLREQVALAETRGDLLEAAALQKQLEEIASEMNVSGCVVEVDIDPQAYPNASWRNVSKKELLSQLDNYLSESQLSCKVFVNGEEKTEKLYKGKAVKKLLDREGNPFASVHIVPERNAKKKGDVIVRVDGASMFTEYTSTGHQVIVEIDKARSRDALSASRDSLKDGYRQALTDFLEELNADVRSALEDKEKRKQVIIKGQKGLHKTAPFEVKVDYGTQAADFSAPARVVSADPQEVERIGGLDDDGAFVVPTGSGRFAEFMMGDLPDDVIGDFLKAVAEGDMTFVGDFGDSFVIDDFQDQARWHRESPEEVFRMFGDDFLRFIGQNLRNRWYAALADARAERDAGLSEMHDFHMQIEDITPQIKKSMKKYDPRKWDPENGKGKSVMMLHAIFTAACNEAFKALAKICPHLGEIKWTTGWLMSKSEWGYEGDDYKLIRKMAMHIKRQDGVHAILLNPLDDDGKDVYKATDRGCWQEIIAEVVHEVSHALGDRHNELFASIMTRLVGAMDFRQTHKAMEEAMKAVSSAYGKGKTSVQRMDSDKGVRPAERLMAHAAPAATVMAGMASVPGNEGLIDGAAELFQLAFDEDEDGVTEVDCDALAEADHAMRTAIARDVSPEVGVKNKM